MASATLFNSITEYIPEGAVNLGSDTLKYALTASGNAPSTSNSILANLTEISYTNASARTATTSSSSQTSGTYKLVLADLVITASGGAIAAFRYVVLWDDTPTSPADPLILFYDYGSALTVNNTETFTIDNDGSNGVLTLA